jgi:hypothetical protein
MAVLWARVLLACVVFLSASCTAQEHEHRCDRLGTVHFASSCNAAAQAELDRAVALLHSFEFMRAVASFNAALQDDPTCGIADWGIALSQWSNPFALGLKDKSQLQAGRESAKLGVAAGARTERERAYLAAVATLYADFETTSQLSRLIAYRNAMEKLASKYPTDNEAQIFYALSISESEDPSDKTYAGRLKAGAILERLFEEQPDHPGLAHYIIHTYDVPPLAPRALNAARRYSEIAPDAPHALHMPSHTFTRTGYWQDSINSNVAATAAAKREGETAEELHASDYEVYAYLQTGQDKAASRIVLSLPDIASRFDPGRVISGAGSPATGYFALCAIPARYALERGDWAQAAKLKPRETPFPQAEAMTVFANGYGSARMGKVASALDAAGALTELHERLMKAGETYWALQVDIQQSELHAWTLWAQGKTNEALQRMEEAAKLEDGTEKSAVTPGPLAPAHELLGEMYLTANQPALALAHYEITLQKEPGRFRALYGAGRAAQLAGKPETSRKYYAELLRICERADTPGRPELAEAKAAIGGTQATSSKNAGVTRP